MYMHVFVYVHIIMHVISIEPPVGGLKHNCSVTNVSGKVNHNQKAKKTKFKFMSDGVSDVTHQCKLDNRKFTIVS